jgi:RNA polymerase sigma factor (sigma-70 family)
VAIDPDACPQLTGDVFREAMRREAAREVRAALTRLPENNRIAVIMFYLRGNTYREIAEFLNVTESTVLGRLHRARSQLRSLLEARIRGDLAAETSERKVDEPR